MASRPRRSRPRRAEAKRAPRRLSPRKRHRGPTRHPLGLAPIRASSLRGALATKQSRLPRREDSGLLPPSPKASADKVATLAMTECEAAPHPHGRPCLTSSSKAKGRQVALPPSKPSREETYFRLLIAVRSTESLATPAALHQLEPKAVAAFAPPLIGVTKPGLALVAEKSLVKALQLPFDRSVSK